MLRQRISYLITSAVLLTACDTSTGQKNAAGAKDTARVSTAVSDLSLPAPYATKSVRRFSDVIGWEGGAMPAAPAGFRVSKFADGFDNPRWIYVGPNGDIFVAEASTGSGGIRKKIINTVSGKSKSQNESTANRITLLRDADGDGVPETRTLFLQGLNRPFGMLIMGNSFYVGNTDGLMQFPYTVGQTMITVPGKKILELPAGGYNNHWTRNIMASKDGRKILIAVGSGSNVGEHGMDNELRRANILEVNPDGSGERIYASGLRNAQGMGYAPGTSTLWTSVNERDELGDELVPDYLTSVREGGFYGWPYAYWGPHPDPRLKGEGREWVAKTIVPDVSLGAHTASLGLAFDERNLFPGKYKGGAFIGQHGSWNRSQFSGYKVVFVPFRNGKPAGKPEDFLTGFITGDGDKVHGRPVGVAFTRNALLVADDAANTIWRVSVP